MHQLRPDMKQEHKNKDILKIWEAIQKGNQKAFDEFYLLFVRQLYNYGHKLTSNTPLVEDCIQELFINLWNNKASIHFRSSVKHYLLLSFRRLLIKKLEQSKIPSKLSSPLRIQKPDIETDLDQLEQEVQKKRVIKAVRQLPKRQKEALFLKYYENMDYDEIGAIMDINKGAVYKLISKGVRKLREMLTLF